MRLTFSLSDAQFAANDRAGLMVGLPLTVQLDAGVMTLGDDAGGSWFERCNDGPAALKPFAMDRCAFCGRVSQLERRQVGEDVVWQSMLDCGLPVRVDLLDPELPPSPPSAPYGLALGDWATGIFVLRGRLAFDPGDLLWQPVQGTIVDIQRLDLTPSHASFGALHWFSGLPRQSFLPDQVYVTVEVR